MATVEMTFTPLPAHVRTARLVATAVARRSGVAEALLDEVRLAVGEACSRAVEVHQEYCPAEPVRVALSGSGGRFEVVVTNTGGHAEGGDGTGWLPHSAAGGSGDRAAAAGPPGAQAAVGAPARPAGAAVSQLPPALPAELGLAVIAGLADDVQVSRTENGLSIRMSWPSGAAAG
jgi:serine/threonine-protein kinase RsbW